MKNSLFTTTLFSILAIAFLTSCAKNENEAHLYSAADFKISRRFDLITPQTTPTLQVFNQANQAVANAQVLIGSAIGSPFKDNLKITDSNGFVSLPEWIEPAHITVQAQGYIRQTLLNQSPGTIQIKLNTAYMTSRPLVKGQVTNLPVKDGDKMIDFSLVIPTISKTDFLSFSLDSIISPHDDTIDIIFGQKAELPSNVSLPTQNEKYNFLISLTLSKPEHRVYTTNYGQKTFYAFSGKFPFKEVMDQLNNDQKFYEVINNFNFTNGSIREININSPSSQLNIPSAEIKFDGPLAQVKSSSISGDEVMMLFAINDLSGGRFVPSDLKRLEANQTASLKTIANKQVQIVSLLKKATDFDTETRDVADRSSASMISYKPDMKSSLLPLLPTGPVITNQPGSTYKIMIPKTSNRTFESEEINELAVSVTVSDIRIVTEGEKQIKIFDRKWEVLGTGWPAEINLPLWPLENSDLNSATKRRFEVNLIGSDSAKRTDLGDDLVKAATHVTKGAAEL